MTDVFGIDGGGNQGGAAEGAQKKKGPPGEGPQGRYMQYDNEMGAMMLDLPSRFAKYKADLEQDIMDEFYGSSAGGKEMHKTINEWITNDWRCSIYFYSTSSKSSRCIRSHSDVVK